VALEFALLAAGLVTVRLPHEPDTLNPLLSGMAVAQEVTRPVLSGLVAVDDRLRFRPDLAREVPTLLNGGARLRGGNLVVTYRLRSDVRWHDGAPFSARDVAFTWRFATDPRARVIDRTGYDRILRVETPSPDTARVVFRGVYAPYLKLFRPVLPAHILAGEEHPNAARFNRKPVGTGPYRVADWVAGDRVELRANPAYHGAKPRIDRLVLQVVPDDNASFVRFKAGDLDVYQSVAHGHLPEIRRLPGVFVTVTPDLLYEHIALNTARPPFDDLRVRQAVARAIDREALSGAAYGGLYPPAWGHLSPLSWAFAERRGSYRPAEARRLLDASGWRPGPDGIRVRDGRRLAFTLYITAGKKPRETSALLVRKQLQEVGFEMAVQAISGASLFSPDGPMKRSAFQAAMWAWDTDLDPDSTSLWHSRRMPPHGSNVSRYRNPRVDLLLEAAVATVDQARRARLYREIDGILARDVPDVPLLHWRLVSATRSRLEGWRPGPAGALWNCETWRLAAEND